LFGPQDSTRPEELGFEITPTSDSRWNLPTVGISGLGSIFVDRSQERYQSETWTLKDAHSLSKGDHSLRMGFDLRRLQEKTSGGAFVGPPSFNFSQFNPFGSENSLADFLLGIPSNYRQSELTTTEPRRTLLSFFFQDDFRALSNLSLNLGLRYDFYGTWTLASGRNATFRPGVQSTVFQEAPPGMLFVGDLDPITGNRLSQSLTPPDRNNFTPRIGVAFSPAISDGPLKFLFGGPDMSVLRAGYGIYTIRNDSLYFKNPDGVFPWALSVNRSAAAIAESGGSFANPWGSDGDLFLVPPDGREFPDKPFVPLIDPGLRDPYQHQWSFSWQRQFPNGFLVEAAYVGSAGRNLLRQYEANQSVLTPDADLSNVEERRQFQQYGSITGYCSDGKSSYHGLQLIGSRRFLSGIQFNLNYTLSKTLSDADGTFGLGDRDVDGWARASIDQRHRFASTFLWEIPLSVHNDFLNQVIGGWRLSGILRIASGSPLNIRNPVDSSLRGISSGVPDIIAPFRYVDPRKVSSFEMPDGLIATGNFFYDPTVFTAIVPESSEEARPGNLGRNTFTGPGVNNLDLSLGKRFSITENHSLDFRADATNFFNHAQFILPGTQWVGTPRGRFQPGRIVSTYGARKIQFYLRYSF
jgi:hypothetical protein